MNLRTRQWCVGTLGWEQQRLRKIYFQLTLPRQARVQMKVVDQAINGMREAFKVEEVYQVAMSKFIVGHKQRRRKAARRGRHRGESEPRNKAQTVENRLWKLLNRGQKKKRAQRSLRGKLS